jgi:cytochrome bd-type quinol oxidase subunit 1
MKVLLSRWQFGITITYHFLFVPLTIGLALLATGCPHWCTQSRSAW